ncbi:MAG: hypothetical protein AAF494_13205, partial [Pseudomonadota bacterium]
MAYRKRSNPSGTTARRVSLLLGAASLVLGGCAATGTAGSQADDVIAAPAPAPSAKVDADQTSKYSAADEELYLKRFNKLLEDARIGAGLNAYDPLEPVAGADDAAPLPQVTYPALSASTLAEAMDYAAQRNSSAFVIVKDGAVHA